MNIKKYILAISLFLGLAGSFAFVATASAQGMASGGWHGGKPGVFGTVSAISGTTLTVQSKARPNKGTATAYTVIASGATVTKNGQASSVSGIAVGDMVMVQGTVSGTSVTATVIRDGMMMGKGMGTNSQPPVITGNGQPIVAGKVANITGNIVTITNSSNVTYTIDATNAKVAKGNTLESLSNVSDGDMVVVQGTVNGTSVTASSITVQGSASSNANAAAPGARMGFMGGVVNFFKHMFGF